jgi:hypothetical protein
LNVFHAARHFFPMGLAVPPGMAGLVAFHSCKKDCSMTHATLQHAVARATGESLATIRRMGFSIANPAEVHHDPEPIAAPKIIDWDEHDTYRTPVFYNRLPRRAA